MARRARRELSPASSTAEVPLGRLGRARSWPVQPPPPATASFGGPDGLARALGAVGYLPSRPLAVALFLALELERPLLLEGPAGVRKTDPPLPHPPPLARALL